MKFKNKQLGAVSGMLISGLALVLMIVIMAGGYASAFNTANRYEGIIGKNWESARETLSSCSVTIRNISKIPAQYQSQLEAIIKAEMEGRYGAPSAERVAIFVKERGVNFDSAALLKVQNTILSCEKNYSDDQKIVIETKANYEIALGSLWQGTFMNMAGFPKKDLNKFKIILDNSSKEQYQNGTREDYDLNEKK